MRKNPVLLAIALMLLIAGALLASLLYRGSPSPGPDTPAQAAAPQVQVLRFGHNIPADSALHQAALRFAEGVRQKSGGRVRVEVFPAQQLGTDDQMLEMARRGELDILLTPTAKLSSALPAMQLADLPFFFPARADLYATLDGEPGRMLLDRLRDIDLVGVTFWENGFKDFTGNKPLLAPEDFAGQKIRVMKSRMLMEQFHELGAQPISIDFHATRQALADGVVDGEENPLIAIVSMGLYQVQSDLTLSSHGYLGYVFMLSAKTFATLPPDIQQIVLDTARELTPWEREETHRREQTLLEQVRQAGVAIHPLDETQRRRFAAVLADIPGRFEDEIGADVLSKAEEMLDDKYHSAHGERITIGLSADLSLDCKVGGLAIKRGAQLAIDDINAAGGVLGKPLVLIARDHKGQPGLGVANVRAFADRPDVVAVLGGIQAGVELEENTVVHERGLPFLLPWSATAAAVDNGQTPNYTFRVSANDRLATPFLIEQVDRRYRHPAILFENSAWGRGSLAAMSARLAQDGRAFVRAESFNRGEARFDALLSAIAQAGADVLVIIANTQEATRILHTLADQPKPLPVVSHWGITCGDFWNANQDALGRVDLSFFQTFVPGDNPRPEAGALLRHYRARFGLAAERSVPAIQGIAQAYDVVRLLALAIEKAGSTDRQAVRAALEHLPPYEGVLRRYAPAFTPERHDALGVEDYRIARYTAHGDIVPLAR